MELLILMGVVMASDNGLLDSIFGSNPEKNLADIINESSPRYVKFRYNELYNSVNNLLDNDNVKNVIQASEFSKIKAFLNQINTKNDLIDDNSLKNLSSIYGFLRSGLALDEMKKSDGVFLKKISGLFDEDGSVIESAPDGSNVHSLSLDSYASKISSEHTDYVEKSDIVNSLYVSWFRKVNDTKNKLQEIYKDKINPSGKASYSKFNSPDVLLKVNKIIGDMNSFHSMISNTFVKIFSTMSNIVNRMI